MIDRPHDHPDTQGSASERHGGGVRRVALLISELQPGGAERVVVHLATTLRRQDLDPVVICLQQEGPLAADLHAADVPVCAVGSMRGYDLGAIRHLAGLFRRHDVDVINVHDRSSLPYAFLANRLAGRRRLVFSAHGLLLQNEGAGRRRDRIAARDLAALTAVSQPSAQEYARILNWDGPVDIIDNGIMPIDRDPAQRARVRRELDLPEHAFTFLGMGNLKPEKGFEDLIAAAALLRQRCPERSCAVLIAGGPADPAYADRLARACRAAGLETTVRLLGYRADAAALYAAADAFVLSSRKEGLPMVLLEAMSAGLPVIATRVGAVPTVITDRQQGLLVEPAQPTQLADALQRVLVDPDPAANLGAAARDHARRHFGAERMTAAYRAVYERVAAPGYRPARTRPGVLMLGPLPPLTGGMATVTDNLRHSPLQQLTRLYTANNGKTTAADRSLVTAVAAQLSLLGRVLATVRRHRIRLVHVHSCALFSFWRDSIHLLGLRLCGARVVWHLHDGTFLQFLSQGHPLKRAAIRALLRAGAAVIVLSNESRNRLQPHAPKVRWRVVCNGVPVPDTTATPDNHRCRFLFLGNLTRRKGAYDLIDALARLHRQGLPVELHLAGGEVEPGQRAEIEAHIAASGAAVAIKLLGLIGGPDKEHALAAANVVALPSYAEGLPMALLEGMSYGLPAVASNVGSIPEAVTPGVEGYLVQPGDVDNLTQHMAHLATDPEHRRRLGVAARQRVVDEFSVDVMARRVYEIYLEALGLTPAEPSPETRA